MSMKIISALVALVVLGAGYLVWQNNTPAPEVTESGTDIYAESAGDINEEMVEIYDGIAIGKSARFLYLNGRGLQGSLKAEIRLFENLEVLDMSNNSLTGVPAEVGQLSKLRVLNLANNPITGLPLELGNLQNLKTLNLSGTNYAEQDLATIKASLPSDVEIITN